MDMEIDKVDLPDKIKSQGTVLWFEFLVDPSLLIPHLENIKPEPSATELITKFLTVYQNGNADVSSKQEFSLREIALKILALKITAHLKWNLQLLQSSLLLAIQVKLLEDLVYITTGEIVRMSKQLLVIDVTTATDEVLFAGVLWHRWIISGLVYRGMQTKTTRLQLTSVIENSYSNFHVTDDFNRYLESVLPNSLKFIHEVIASKRIPKILKASSFIALTDGCSEMKQNWDEFTAISLEDFQCQLHFDLAAFYFFKAMWSLSKKHFMCSFELYKQTADKNNVFTTFSLLELKGYLLACGEPIDNYQTSLLYKFYSSIRNGFAGTVNIMLQDNIERSLPLVHRRMLEVETLGAVSCEKYYVAKDILLQFFTLNIARDVIDGITIYPAELINCLNSNSSKPLDMLLSAILPVVFKGSESDKKRVKLFFIELASNIKNLGDKINSHQTAIKELFSEFELIKMNEASSKKYSSPPKSVKSEMHYVFETEYASPAFKLKLLQKQIIDCYDVTLLSNLVQDFLRKSKDKPLWRINAKWQLPIPLQSVVMTIEDSHIQNIIYIILAKGRESMLAKDYATSLKMYSQLDVDFIRSNTAPSISKLWKLVSWEILLTRVMQYTDEWPAENIRDIDKVTLIAKCKECLSTQQNDYSGNVIPRTEVVEHLSLFLLNVGEWDYLASLEKRWNYFELTTAVATACQDLIKYKGSKKIAKDVWELVLAAFAPVHSKRSIGGSVVHRDSPSTKTKLNMASFMLSLRNETALNVVISLLARLYNILKDESSLELVVDYVSLWPAVVSNANSYNSKSVSEMLWQMLEIALLHYPNNICWLRLKGDVNFCNGYPEAALKCYISSLIVASEYFSLPLVKPLLDNHTVKRMIKCCIEMNCYTQAVVLCQFLERIDYATAIECLTEHQSYECGDAMDAYYSCIWDMTLLEYLIHIHHMRGEEHRKREAIRIIGQLELNANNIDEIKREACDVRKKKFMRALAKQYVIKYPI